MQTNHWQLFIDDHLVARSTGFDRVVHHPRARGVVIPADQPWETAGVVPIYMARQADGTFVAFYMAMWWDIDSAHAFPGNLARDRAHHKLTRIGYATSADGIHWQKPALGLVDAPAGIDWQRHAPYPSPTGTTPANNLGVPFVVVADLGRDGNVADPARRFALRLLPEDAPVDVGSTGSVAPQGYFAAVLPDFLHDPVWRDKLVDASSSFSPRHHLIQFWDDHHREWVALGQGVAPHWIPSREIGRFASPDLVYWHSQAVLYPDSDDPHLPHRYDEAMGLTPFCAEGVVFGLLSWFHSDRTDPDGGPVLEPTAANPFRWPYARKGTNEMRITLSRDGGLTWDRTSSREAWIAHGSEEDSYDRLVLWPMPPIRVGDEDWYYMDVIDGDHLITRNSPDQGPCSRDRVIRHQIALYTQQHNRYVSLSARGAAVLISRPIQVTGSQLELNVDAGRGRVQVALAAAAPLPTYDGSTPSTAPHLYADQPLPGFSWDDCIPIQANSIAHPVQWASQATLDALQGRWVHLLICCEDADLYGVRFADAETANEPE